MQKPQLAPGGTCITSFGFFALVERRVLQEVLHAVREVRVPDLRRVLGMPHETAAGGLRHRRLERGHSAERQRDRVARHRLEQRSWSAVLSLGRRAHRLLERGPLVLVRRAAVLERPSTGPSASGGLHAPLRGRKAAALWLLVSMAASSQHCSLFLPCLQHLLDDTASCLRKNRSSRRGVSVAQA